MYNREAINILLWKAEMPCLNVWGVSQASQLCDRCHMSPELCTTTPTTGHVYRPTFPPISLNECGYLQLGPMERLPFAQYPVSHFTQQDWDIIWERPVIDLNPYLMTMEYNNHPNLLPTVFHPE